MCDHEWFLNSTIGEADPAGGIASILPLVYPSKINGVVYINTCQVDRNRSPSKEDGVVIDTE